MVLVKSETNTSLELIGLIDDKIKLNPIKGDGLYGGESGVVLYRLYAFLITGDIKYKNKVLVSLNEIIEKIGTPSGMTGSVSLSAGFTGLGWVFRLLKKHGVIGDDFNDFIYELDERIYKRSLKEIDNLNFDYMHGALGALTYLCEGDLTDEHSKMHIESLVREIIKTKPAGADYIKSEYIFRKLKFTIEDDLNLGLVHGLCGILIGFLRVYEKGLLQNEIREVVEKGIGYILSLARFEHEDDLNKSIFPTNRMLSLSQDDPENRAFYNFRMGWCYGDLNQVLLLYRAGHILDNSEWVALARKIGKRCLKRKTEDETWVNNPYLCHGSAGQTIIYQNLRQLDPELFTQYNQEVAFWDNETEFYLKNIRNDQITDVSFLNGLAGVALARFAVEYPEFSDWHKMMLLY